MKSSNKIKTLQICGLRELLGDSKDIKIFGSKFHCKVETHPRGVTWNPRMRNSILARQKSIIMKFGKMNVHWSYFKLDECRVPGAPMDRDFGSNAIGTVLKPPSCTPLSRTIRRSNILVFIWCREPHRIVPIQMCTSVTQVRINVKWQSVPVILVCNLQYSGNNLFFG